jgi:hypothetical protein
MSQTAAASFSADFQILCALITHLGAHERWQSRTPSEIAGSLAMDRHEIERVLGAYPCFFRESANRKNGERCFTVHLRYARRHTHPVTGAHESLPLTPEEIGMLINTLTQMVSIEREESRFVSELRDNNRRQTLTNLVALSVAVISAIAVLVAAMLKRGG